MGGVVRADPNLGSLPHPPAGLPQDVAGAGPPTHCQLLVKPCSLACQESLPSSHLLSTCSELRHHQGLPLAPHAAGGGGALPNTPCAPSAPAAKRTRTNRAVQQAELMPAHTGSLRCQSKNIAIEEGAQKWSPTGPRALGAKRGFVPQDRPVGQRKGGDALALLHPLSPTAYRQTGQGALGDS